MYYAEINAVKSLNHFLYNTIHKKKYTYTYITPTNSEAFINSKNNFIIHHIVTSILSHLCDLTT